MGLFASVGEQFKLSDFKVKCQCGVLWEQA